MKFTETGIDGLTLIEPRVFRDERGFFMETYNEAAFHAAGLKMRFVQDNFSHSSRGVLRGLHFQNSPMAQGKLVRVTMGAVWDVAVDLRRGSQTFGEWRGFELTAENKHALYVPEGFAHGFCVLSDRVDFEYKCTALYSPPHERGIRWDDPDLKIPWPIKDVIVSGKDTKLGSFADYAANLG